MPLGSTMVLRSTTCLVGTLCLALDPCPSPFMLYLFFGEGLVLFAWASSHHNLLTYAPFIAGLIDACHYDQTIC
jgi:hypothetical protein